MCLGRFEQPVRLGNVMSLENSLDGVVQQIPDCVAAGMVDIDTGRLLGIRGADSQPQEVNDLLAAAAGDLFQGPTVVSIEKMFQAACGMNPDAGCPPSREVIVFSDHYMHVFVRDERHAGQVLMTVCRPTASVGLVLAKAHASLAHLTC